MSIVRENPVEKYLRMERMPSIWCPGCGIGTTVNCFARALDGSGFDLDKVAIVSGIGCTGRVAGYLKLDSSRARAQLGWAPRWTLERALDMTIEWHEAWSRDAKMREVCLAQIAAYVQQRACATSCRDLHLLRLR